jgi:hypothetical protein
MIERIRGGRAIAGTKNLMIAAAGAISAAAVTSTLATPQSPLVQRAASTLAAAETQVEAIAATLPSDLRQALHMLVEEGRRLGEPVQRPMGAVREDPVFNVAAFEAPVAFGSLAGGVTPIDLFRVGNVAGPRLDAVRTSGSSDDVVTYTGPDSTIWVRAHRGGVPCWGQESVLSSLRGRVWRLPAGTAYSGLILYLDPHMLWRWAPIVDMPFKKYAEALRAVGRNFVPY